MKTVNISPQKHLLHEVLRILKDAGWSAPRRIDEDKLALEAAWGTKGSNIRLLIANRHPTTQQITLKGWKDGKQAVESFSLVFAGHLRKLKKTAEGLVKEGAPVKRGWIPPITGGFVSPDVRA